MGCGCHSAKKAQPVRQTISKRVTPVRRTVQTSSSTEPIVRNVYGVNGGSLKKRIIRRTISH